MVENKTKQGNKNFNHERKGTSLWEVGRRLNTLEGSKNVLTYDSP